MKYKLYNFLDNEKLLGIKNSEALTHFEILGAEDISAEDLIKQKYDVIEIDGSRYEEFVNFIPTIDWKTSHISSADCLILKNNVYKPYNILSEALIRILKKNVGRVNSQLPVIVVGDIYFAYSVVTKLALSGFIEIIVSLTTGDGELVNEFEKKIRSFVFNLNLKTVPIGDLTSVELTAFLLISNFQKEKNSDAYDLLSYFNFLSEDAIFIDCNSIKDGYLVDDARKAEIFVVDELEVLENKYNYLLELLKNSP